MKLSEKWLREWVNPQLTTTKITELLTMSGLELEGLTPAATPFTEVVIGKIMAIQAHPNAEKLSICEINVGKNAPLRVVTGATNVTQGKVVPVAQVGAHLSAIHQENEKLASTELRGEKSFGMLCSKQELGLGTDSEGIWILPDDAPMGESLWQYLQLDDTLIEIDLTPNRGDCLSVYGLAREVSTLTGSALKALNIETVKATSDAKFNVTLDAVDYCPRYVGRSIRNVGKGITPMWMVEKLRRSDIRCIHPVVDILNYVMIELGQPMHAFDQDKLQGKVLVRLSNAGEKINLLDGQEITLKANTLVIADQAGPQAIAGIMGGNDSAVTSDTQNIFLESALFTASLIAGKARLYGLHTDSSFRFERGVDPELQILAMERATSLICEICGGEPGPVMEEVSAEHLPQKKMIPLRYQRVVQILGQAIPLNQISDILQRLHCEVVEKENQQWWVHAPTYRYDLTSEIDLIEEIARIVGYNQIPATMPISHMQFIGQSEQKVSTSRIKRALVDLGFQEVITYSFVDEALQKLLMPEEKALPLVNPISADMNVMRLSLWPGLLTALKYNQYRQQARMKFFEVGMCFNYQKDELIQANKVGGVICGDAQDENWNHAKRASDFFDMKQPIESLWRLLGFQQRLEFQAASHPACHPGQSAHIVFNGKILGILGQLHPQLYKQLGVDGPIYLFELDLNACRQKPMPQFARPSKFPEIRRDIAVIVDDQLLSDNLIKFVRKSAGEMLRDVKIFDVYTGKGIDSGRKSIAMGLILQHPSRTLIDKEVDEIVHAVVKGLEREFSAELRD